VNITSRWGNSLLDNGFVMIPNILIDKQEELGITDDELLFIIKCMRHQDGYKIHDSQLSETASSKTMQRRRKSLKDKGYLEVEIHKMQKEDGTWMTEGLVYVFKGLMIALNEIYAKEQSERSKQEQVLPKKSAHHNNKYNTSRKEVPAEVVEYMDEYKLKYGVDYKLTSDEKLLLENATPEFLRSIKYIPDYTAYQKEYGKLPTSFTGRLVFFQKVLWRQAELIEFANQEIEYLSRG
jgi:hypothetical protein